jgi:glycosyltransferase involved in cell wall biosynthesis
MPPITALLHTSNDALRLGRALETVLPCREILVIDHGSSDATRRVAMRYGARFARADARSESECARLASNEWILCLEPSESLTEMLQATLFEWSSLRADEVSDSAFNVFAREQHGEVWLQQPLPETRLVPRSWTGWKARLPRFDPKLSVLEGNLLRLGWP